MTKAPLISVSGLTFTAREWKEVQNRCYADSQNDLTVLEAGFDARLDELGRLHIQTNNPTGCLIQTLTLGPEATRKLMGFLLMHMLEAGFGPISSKQKNIPL